MMAGDVGRIIEVPGPWQHRYVAANGARFHVADTDPGAGAEKPLVLLLHGFPEFWWAWRSQLPALAEAGYRAAAMDLRGYGGSDKTPRGYDPLTLAQDVSGVVKALGHRSAVLVGQGWGGYVGWATAVLHPVQVSALAVLAAPHPLVALQALRSGAAAVRHVLAMQVPMLPERRLADPASGFLAQHLQAWSAPGSGFPDSTALARYQQAISLWPASHCALEYHRWLFRSRVRADGRHFNALMRAAPVSQPVCCLVGDRDPAVPVSALDASRRWVRGDFTGQVVPDAGHYLQEERPQEVSSALLGWLRDR